MRYPNITLATGQRIEFVWGEIINNHHLGEYTIIEYTPIFNGKRDEEVAFHSYVGDKDTCESWPSLDASLVGAIAYKHEGGSSQSRAAFYFCKMVGME